MIIPAPHVLKRTLTLSLAGTRGGPVRLQILLMLEKNPRNVNEIAKAMALDYKTVEYHMRVLEKSGFITSSKKKYDNTYTLSTLLALNKNILREIAGDMGKSN